MKLPPPEWQAEQGLCGVAAPRERRSNPGPARRVPPASAESESITAAYWEINKEAGPVWAGRHAVYRPSANTIISSVINGPARCLFISAQISTENRLLTMGSCSRRANLDRASQTGSLLLG